MTIPDPPKYNANNALAINICVTGSVEGVMTAANIVETTSTYFQAASIFLPDTIPNKPKIIWITGTWKAKPVVNIKTATKSKYWSEVFPYAWRFGWVLFGIAVLNKRASISTSREVCDFVVFPRQLDFWGKHTPHELGLSLDFICRRAGCGRHVEDPGACPLLARSYLLQERKVLDSGSFFFANLQNISAKFPQKL